MDFKIRSIKNNLFRLLPRYSKRLSTLWTWSSSSCKIWGLTPQISARCCRIWRWLRAQTPLTRNKRKKTWKVSFKNNFSTFKIKCCNTSMSTFVAFRWATYRSRIKNTMIWLWVCKKTIRRMPSSAAYLQDNKPFQRTDQRTYTSKIDTVHNNCYYRRP